MAGLDVLLGQSAQPKPVHPVPFLEYSGRYWRFCVAGMKLPKNEKCHEIAAIKLNNRWQMEN